MVAAEVAAAVALEADLLITPNVSNHADSTLEAQVSNATKTEDAEVGVVEKPQLISQSGKSVDDIVTVTTAEGDTVDSLAQNYWIFRRHYPLGEQP